MHFASVTRRFAALALLCLFGATHLGAADEPRPLFVEGYAGQLSVQPGEEVAFHVSTSAAKFSVEIARVGGKREVVWTGKDLPGREHPVPENASSHGCGWPVSFKVPVAANWRSGYYVASLRAEDRGGLYTQRGPRTAASHAT